MGNEQIKAFGKSAAIIIWFHLASICCSTIALFISGDIEQFTLQHSNFLNMICYGLIFIGVYLVDQHKKQLWQSLRPSKGWEGFKETILYIEMGIGAYIIGTTITWFLIPLFPDYVEITDGFNQYEPILRFISIVILPPLVEEYLFRYRIQGFLKEGFGTTLAIVGQALLFGILHHYIVQKIYAIALGILFGWIREKKGIRATFWMHITVNGIGCLMGCLFYLSH